jgi:hypothetical protein
MYAVSVSDVLVGSYYRSGRGRNLDGTIVEARLVDEYDGIYKIRFRDNFTSTYHWATIQVLQG